MLSGFSTRHRQAPFCFAVGGHPKNTIYFLETALEIAQIRQMFLDLRLFLIGMSM